jgi:hypothetical protein
VQTHLSGAKTLEQSLVDTILDFYPKKKFIALFKSCKSPTLLHGCIFLSLLNAFLLINENTIKLGLRL